MTTAIEAMKRLREQIEELNLDASKCNSCALNDIQGCDRPENRCSYTEKNIELSLADARAIANDVLVSEVIEACDNGKCNGCHSPLRHCYYEKGVNNWELAEIKKMLEVK